MWSRGWTWAWAGNCYAPTRKARLRCSTVRSSITSASSSGREPLPGAPVAIQFVFVSCPPDRAADLARQLVDARLAACVNVLPAMRSIYRWQDRVHDDAEALLLIKAPATGFAALKAYILAHHPYELPEIVAVNVDQGHAPYLDWVISACE